MDLTPEEKRRIYDHIGGKRITFRMIFKFIFLLLIIAFFVLFFYSNLEYYLKTGNLVGPGEKLRTRNELGIK
ncbi:hypothetical protein KKB84_02990 [bacterium]|nr:hypothetical protein [bacterium]